MSDLLDEGTRLELGVHTSKLVEMVKKLPVEQQQAATNFISKILVEGLEGPPPPAALTPNESALDEVEPHLWAFYGDETPARPEQAL